MFKPELRRGAIIFKGSRPVHQIIIPPPIASRSSGEINRIILIHRHRANGKGLPDKSICGVRIRTRETGEDAL